MGGTNNGGQYGSRYTSSLSRFTFGGGLGWVSPVVDNIQPKGGS